MTITFRCDPALLDSLPRPVPARQALPDWLRAMPREAFSEMHGEALRTVKHCPPFVDAMSAGFVIPLPCDLMVADGRITWNWTLPPLAARHHPRAPISFHSPAQVEGTPLWSADQVVVKFNSFWTVELPEGWSLFATHPANRLDLPFRLLSGLVDADRFRDVPILFPALWVDPDFSGVLPRGTPVAQCLALPRAQPDLAYAGFTAEEAARYDATAERLLAETGVYRKDFRAPRSGGARREDGGEV
ncbi:hypothetical protein [Acidisoma sp. 7E03]